MNTNYEKPQMRMVTLVNKIKVADSTCWSTAPKMNPDELWYYDYNGKDQKGYLTFHTTGDCGGWANDITIVPENAEGGQEAAIELAAFLNAKGPNNGQHIFTDNEQITDDPTQVS